MLLFLSITAALAAPCPTLQSNLDAAWAAFNDAELDRADDALRAAMESLSCETSPVRRPELLELYWLRALTALARGDREAANVAVVRAVTIDPKARPPASYGPNLATLVDTWNRRLAGDTVSVSMDVSEGWVDGEPIGSTRQLAVIPGDHLLQWRDHDDFHSETRDLTKDFALVTKPPPSAPLVAAPTAPAIVPPPTHPGATLRPVFLTTGALSAAAGATLAVIAYRQQSQIEQNGYTEDSYGTCDWFDDCYAEAREETMRADTRRVRTFYGVGASLFGFGVALVGVELVVHPNPTGTRVSVSGTW